MDAIRTYEWIRSRVEKPTNAAEPVEVNIVSSRNERFVQEIPFTQVAPRPWRQTPRTSQWGVKWWTEMLIRGSQKRVGNRREQWLVGYVDTRGKITFGPWKSLGLLELPGTVETSNKPGGPWYVLLGPPGTVRNSTIGSWNGLEPMELIHGMLQRRLNRLLRRSRGYGTGPWNVPGVGRWVTRTVQMLCVKPALLYYREIVVWGLRWAV